VESMKRPWLVALCGYVVLSIVLTYPTVLAPIDTVVGHVHASVACHIWILWWAQHHISEIASSLIFFPYGADVIQLYGSDLLSPPLLGLLPLPPSLLHNIWVHLLMLIGAMGARQLALYSGVSQGAALVSGVIFMSAPFFQHEILNGTSELISTGLLPWYTWLLFRILEKPTIKLGVWIGVVAGCALVASAYNPFFMLVITLPVLCHRAISSKQTIFTRELIRSSIVALSVFGVFLGYVAWLHLNHGAGETFTRRTDWLDTSFMLPDAYAGISDWIDPRETDIPMIMSLPDGKTFEYWTTCTVYLGWVVLIATLWGWKRSKKSNIAALRWILILSVIIASGPYVRMDGELITVFDNPIPLPTITIGLLFPPFAITAIHAYRYTSVAVLALSVLAVQRIKAPWWALLVVAEVLFWAPQPWPAPVTQMPDSPVLESLQQMPDGAVFTYPMAKEDLHDLGQILLAQTVHGKPVHDGGIHRRAGKDAVRLFSENFVINELSHRSKADYPSIQEAKVGFEGLKSIGYRYVLAPQSNKQAVAWGEEVLGEALQKDTEWCLWEL